MADLGVEFRFPFAGNVGGVDGAEGYGKGKESCDVKFESGFHGWIVLRGLVSVKVDKPVDESE